MIHADSQAMLTLAGHRIRRQSNDGCPVTVPFPTPEFYRRLVTIHFRHLAVHEHHVEMTTGKKLQSFPSILGDFNPAA